MLVSRNLYRIPVVIPDQMHISRMKPVNIGEHSVKNGIGKSEHEQKSRILVRLWRDWSLNLVNNRLAFSSQVLGQLRVKVLLEGETCLPEVGRPEGQTELLLGHVAKN